MAEWKPLFATDHRSIVLDLRDVRLADHDAVKFPIHSEKMGSSWRLFHIITSTEWMKREKG